jgi:hypothetical protein
MVKVWLAATRRSYQYLTPPDGARADAAAPYGFGPTGGLGVG